MAKIIISCVYSFMAIGFWFWGMVNTPKSSKWIAYLISSIIFCLLAILTLSGT